MSLLFDCIYGSAEGFDTLYSEASHKTHLKAFFPRTNRNEGWEIQILQHNGRRHNIISMDDILIWLKTEETPISKDHWKVGLIKANREIQ